MDTILYFILIFICIVMSAFFSSSETALLRLRKDETERDLSDHKGLSVLAVRELTKSSSRLLITILLGNNVVNILAASSASAVAIFYFGEEKGIIIATILMTVIVLIFAEILPKALAARNPKKVSYFVALPLYMIHQLLRPIHFIFHRAIDPIIKRVAGEATSELEESEDLLLHLARHTPTSKVKKGSPLPIISSAAKAAELNVAQIMIPRTELFAFPIETSPQKIFNEALKERYTRILIYENSIDRILGVVHFKELALCSKNKNLNLRDILKPILRVPEKKPILSLLKDMQKGFIHLAVVKDEFGVTQGIVTQEDILEEIVGEIRDEFDSEELKAIKKQSDGTYIAIGRVLVQDFNRETGWNILAEPGETLSGLIFNRLGRPAKKSDMIKIERYAIKVMEVSGTRITRVKIEPLNVEQKTP